MSGVRSPARRDAGRGASSGLKEEPLLLDEIVDMPATLQSKLLRVLQEREIQRVGGASTVPVDVRVIAATNRSLEAAIGAGKFRVDLYYRIAAFPITIPALTERRDDIPLLVDHFVKESAARNNKPMDGVSSGALRLLLQYEWPGNVRELQGVIDRAVLLETTNVLQVGSLPSRFGAVGQADRPAGELWLAEVERQAIVRALKASGNNVTRAARALGINRSTLHRKLKNHNLRRPGDGDGSA